jgi:septum formation protein
MPSKAFYTRPIILASQSPRRSQLMREAGFEFSVQSMDIDESFPSDMPVGEVAPWLAQQKARAASSLIRDQEVVVAADSVVILNEKIFNKPADYQEAFAMIRALSGQKHRVVTGVCVLCRESEQVLAGITDVWMEGLSDEEINYYIEAYKPYDKAGAYGAQEWIGHCKISRLEGTYQNVMGLPMDLVYKALMKLQN